MRKKMLWSRDVRWPASIFPLLDLLSRRRKNQKIEFSHQVQFPTSPKYSRFPELLYSTYIVCMVVGKNVVLAPARMWSRRRMFGPGKEFLGAQSTTIFFFFLINGSSKESRPSEAHPRIFFLSLLLLLMTCINPFELFFTGSFFFFSSSKSPCGNFDYLTGLFAWNDVVELETQEKKFDCDNCS